MYKSSFTGLALSLLLTNNVLAYEYTSEDMMFNAWMMVLQSKDKSVVEATHIATNLADIVSGKATRAAMRGQDCSTSSNKIADDLKANAYNLGASIGEAQALVKYTSEYAVDICQKYKDSH